MAFGKSLSRLLSPSKGPRLKPSDAAVRKTNIQRYYAHANGGDAYLSLYDRAAEITGSQNKFVTQNRFFTLYQMVNRLLDRGVEGDVAECGCWHGLSAFITAETLAARGWTGKVWVFDSFEGGLSSKVAEDRRGRAAKRDNASEKAEKDKFISSYDAVKKNFERFPFVSIHKGWIPQVFDAAQGLAERRFALVHVDVDLYEPTRDSLAFFGPRMSPGGVIVFDDYGSANFPGATQAIDEFRAATPHSFFLETHLMGAVLAL
ncbi:TylF/MycF/NovP-related O-methyltransferase [Hansschlegelia quercus]|uniref:Methyltransferase n=1 Tax=Hansschlegelia quercus TaxID=2528245 RepID=A0A4Q9GMH2_9HYPH|nr:TylF/MycF/NovP-related O-methyltransferase [Hansschlegelia quercus]TBN54651.1 hypothetical protein EYR15_00275 [Hansschlegelia quercus]